MTYINLEQFEDAFKYNQMALEIEPNDHESLNRKGTILINQKKYEEATDIF